MTQRLVALVLAALLLAPPAALAQSPPPTAGAAPGTDAASEGAWPREMSVNGAAVLIYEADAIVVGGLFGYRGGI